MENTNKSAVLKWALIVGIVVIINLFINYSLSLIFSEPEWDKYCKPEQVKVAPTTEATCLANGGSWTSYPEPVQIDSSTPVKIVGYCDQYFECQNNYNKDREAYEKKVFISLISIGVIILIVGLVLKNNQVISFALAFAAILDFIIASIRYWTSADSLIKVIILAIALIALIAAAYKMFGNSSSSSKDSNAGIRS